MYMNDYYVYIYWRLDTNEPFYIGKGHDNRWKTLKRENTHFNNIVNKYPIAVEIIKDNLTEEQAHNIECWIIHQLVFDYGYSIDIPNNRSKERGRHLVNATWGGEGTSGKCHKGKNNPMWKHDWGENHPMKGKKHKKESKEKISRTRIEKGIGKGENHPNHGKHLSQETKDKLREKGLERAENGVYDFLKVKVICLTDMKIYNSLKEASKNEDYINICGSGISLACRNYKNSKICGKLKDGTPLIWMYLDDYLNMTEEDVKQYLSTVKIKKSGVNNSNARKFILRFNSIDLTMVMTKGQLCKFLKTGEKNLKKILNNDGIIDKNMFPKNISKVIQYFDKCEIIELDK